jgi:hypothetical protein
MIKEHKEEIVRRHDIIISNESDNDQKIMLERSKRNEIKESEDALCKLK